MASLTLLDFAVRLGVGLGCGALIGVERQWRARMAGLRTNASLRRGRRCSSCSRWPRGMPTARHGLRPLWCRARVFLGGGSSFATGSTSADSTLPRPCGALRRSGCYRPRGCSFSRSGVGLVTEQIWLFSWSSFGRGSRVIFAPGRFGVGEGVEHQLAPGERPVDREVSVPGAETHACGCRTVPGALPAVAQLGESVGDGGHRAEDAPDAVAAVRSRPGRGVQPERKLCCRSQFG
jgi:hypothetical protein